MDLWQNPSASVMYDGGGTNDTAAKWTLLIIHSSAVEDHKIKQQIITKQWVGLTLTVVENNSSKERLPPLLGNCHFDFCPLLFIQSVKLFSLQAEEIKGLKGKKLAEVREMTKRLSVYVGLWLF